MLSYLKHRLLQPVSYPVSGVDVPGHLGQFIGPRWRLPLRAAPLELLLRCRIADRRLQLCFGSADRRENSVLAAGDARPPATRLHRWCWSITAITDTNIPNVPLPLHSHHTALQRCCVQVATHIAALQHGALKHPTQRQIQRSSLCTSRMLTASKHSDSPVGYSSLHSQSSFTWHYTVHYIFVSSISIFSFSSTFALSKIAPFFTGHVL